MPYLLIQTNLEIAAEDRLTLLGRASQCVANMLGKSEAYVMVQVHSGCALMFAGGTAPAAYLELKSIGLPEDATPRFASVLCEFIQQQLSINKERVYVEFKNAPAHLWGWDGVTF